MQERTLSITTLAMLTAMAGIYSFMAGAALMFIGSFGAAEGWTFGNLVFALGAVFLGLSVAASVVAVGVWFRRSWSWIGTIVVFATLIAANLFLSLVASNFVNLILPAIGTVAAMWSLSQPATKAALLGEAEADEQIKGQAADAPSGIAGIKTPA